MPYILIVVSFQSIYSFGNSEHALETVPQAIVLLYQGQTKNLPEVETEGESFEMLTFIFQIPSSLPLLH